MGDDNPIGTLGDYSKPTHEGYRNTNELPEGNNMAPLRSNTIRLCKTNAYSMDFGSISTWEDLTTRFLAQFFPSGRTAKLRNDILMLQQHQVKSLSEAWTRFKDLLVKNSLIKASIVGFKSNFFMIMSPFTLNAKLTAPSVGWNDSKDCVKPVKAISTSQTTSKNPDRRLLELEDQINFLLKEKNVEDNGPIDRGIVEPGKPDEEEPPKVVNIKNEVERKADDKPTKSTEENVTKNEVDEPAGAFRIAKDVLVNVAGYVPVDFMILDIREDKDPSSWEHHS
nr:hypothetical protein [Tanacetum cinerariifolium]